MSGQNEYDSAQNTRSSATAFSRLGAGSWALSPDSGLSADSGQMSGQNDSGQNDSGQNDSGQKRMIVVKCRA